jgi:hypothetical protein
MSKGESPHSTIARKVKSCDTARNVIVKRELRCIFKDSYIGYETKLLKQDNRGMDRTYSIGSFS